MRGLLPMHRNFLRRATANCWNILIDIAAYVRSALIAGGGQWVAAFLVPRHWRPATTSVSVISRSQACLEFLHQSFSRPVGRCRGVAPVACAKIPHNANSANEIKLMSLLDSTIQSRACFAIVSENLLARMVLLRFVWLGQAEKQMGTLLCGLEHRPTHSVSPPKQVISQLITVDHFARHRGGASQQSDNGAASQIFLEPHNFGLKPQG